VRKGWVWPGFDWAPDRPPQRIGEEFQDIDDIRYLLRHIDIRSYDAALEVITKFHPLERFPPKTLYALEELLENGNDSRRAR